MPQGGLKDRLVLTVVVGKGHTKGLCSVYLSVCVAFKEGRRSLSLCLGTVPFGSTEGDVGSSVVVVESYQAFILQ